MQIAKVKLTTLPDNYEIVVYLLDLNMPNRTEISLYQTVHRNRMKRISEIEFFKLGMMSQAEYADI